MLSEDYIVPLRQLKETARKKGQYDETLFPHGKVNDENPPRNQSSGVNQNRTRPISNSTEIEMK